MILYCLLLYALFAQAQQTFFLTEYPPIAALDSCASKGFINAANSLINDCNTLLGPTAFASCACQKDQNYDSVSEQIVSWVTYFCSSTATQDITSAVGTFSSYCAAVPPKPTPVAILPPKLATLPSLTDLSTAVTLPPCVASAMRVAVGSVTYDIPPLANIAEQASCACIKNDNSAAISSNIIQAVQYFCSSTATEDVSSALAAFSTYCVLGKANLPNTTFAPMITSVGPMSAINYVTSLASCASDAFISAVNQMTTICDPASGVAAFASCVCGNATNSNSISVSIVSNVEYRCGTSTVTEDVTSALAVMSSYCAQAGGRTGPATAAMTGPGAVPTNTTTTVNSLHDTHTASSGLSTVQKAIIGAGAAGFLLCLSLYICCFCGSRSYTGTDVNLVPVRGTGGGGGDGPSWNYRNNAYLDRPEDGYHWRQDSWTTSRPLDTGPSSFAIEEARQDALRAAGRQRDDDIRAADRERDSRAVVDNYMKIPI